jgi:transposase
MRKLRDFVVQGQEVFVGLEDSKKTWKICVNSRRIVVHEASMPADYEVLKNYLKRQFPECKIHVMYEAGFSGFGLCDALTADGYTCVVTPPHTVTEAKCQKLKNDRIDCRRLAKNLESGDYRSCFVPDKGIREDRQISRVYGQLSNDLVRVKNRIRRLLEFHGLDRYFPSGAWSERNYRELLSRLAGHELSDSLMFCLKSDLKEIELLRALQKEVLVKLRELSKARYKASVAVLQTAPGIGPLTAIRLALEWGDVKRFNRKEDFASFLGLIPGEYSTGENERKGHITKQGNRFVRKWLVEAAWRSLKLDPVLLDKFQRVWHNTGSKKKAIVAVARKLAIRLRAMLIGQQNYLIGVEA